MNKRKTMAALAGALAACGLIGLLVRGQFPAGAEAAEPRPGSFATASVGPVRDVIVAKGTVAYDHQLVVRAPLGGRIDGLIAPEGSRIARGQELVRVRDPQDEHEMALRRIEERRCQARRDALAKDVQALGRLVEIGSSAPYELDQAKLELGQADKECERARIEIARLGDKQALGSVRSPLDGLVVASGAVAGQSVGAGEELLTVAGGERPFIVSYLEAMDLGRIAVGQKVTFSDQEDSERRRTGRVKEIGRAVAGNQRQNTVKLVIAPLEPIDDLRLNQQLYVEFVTREEDAVLRVPRELVYERGGQRLVNVLTSEGVRARPIRTAPGDASFDKVVSGIGAADRLLPRNALPGMAQ